MANGQRTNRYLYFFMRNGFMVRFGPYVTVEDAKSAFQRTYGYWPEDPVKQVAYDYKSTTTKSSGSRERRH